MNQYDGPLNCFLLLYQLVEDTSNADATFHIQLYPGHGDNTSFKLLLEKLSGKIKVFDFLRNKPLLSLSVEDGDILFIRATNNEFVTTGGIWQIQWQNSYSHVGSYILTKVSSSGIEMVEVAELLQEEEFVLFEDAVVHAKTFLEALDSSRNSIWFVNGREVGVSAPEIIHQVTPLPHNIRTIEHTWHIVLASIKEYFPRTIYSLIEVAYHFQHQEWQVSVRLLAEDHMRAISGQHNSAQN